MKIKEKEECLKVINNEEKLIESNAH